MSHRHGAGTHADHRGPAIPADRAGQPDGIVGIVAGRAVSADRVAERLAELYASPVAVKLPVQGDAEWRRLRRWVAQLVLTEALVTAEAARAGIDPGADSPQWTDRVELFGTLAAAVLAHQPLARALRDHLTAGVAVDERAVEAYYRRNTDRFRHPAMLRGRHHLAADEATARAALENLDEAGESWHRAVSTLPGPLREAVRAAAAGDVVGPVHTAFGWHVVSVDALDPAGVAPPAQVAGVIRAELLTAARAAHFQRWLEARRRARVASGPGFEHPGDPAQPDFSHHH